MVFVVSTGFCALLLSIFDPPRVLLFVFGALNTAGMCFLTHTRHTLDDWPPIAIATLYVAESCIAGFLCVAVGFLRTDLGGAE